MIQLTRLNNQPIVVNSDMIKFVENAHDTVLTLINGEKMIVREPTEDVIARIIEFRRAVLAGMPNPGVQPLPTSPTTTSGRTTSHQTE